MDKQKQIEDLTALIDSFNIRTIKQAKYVAEYIVDKLNYRKIPEGSVVLTKEDLREKIDCCNVSMIHHDDDGKRYIEYEEHCDFTDRLGKRIQQLKGLLKQERKETAEKFALKLADYFVENCRGRLSISLTLQEWYKMIDEICKELTK